MGRSIKDANKASARQNALDSLDSFGSDQFNFDLVGTNENPYEDAIGRFIERVKENIQSSDMVVSGAIEDIRMKIEDNKILITGNPWLIYQDRGVNGSVIKKYDTPHSYTDKMPPPDVIIEYIKTKNIQLRNNENMRGKLSPFEDISGDDKAITSAAWGMAMKVFREGFKPRHIYSKEIPELIEDLKTNAADFAVQQVKQIFNIKDEAKRISIKK